MIDIPNAVAWRDLLPRGDARRDEERGDNDNRAMLPGGRLRKPPRFVRQPEPEPIRQRACPGQWIDVGSLARHLGCGPRAAIDHATRAGWGCQTMTVRRGRGQRELEIRVWQVPATIAHDATHLPQDQRSSEGRV
jgi:hypothetical protein